MGILRSTEQGFNRRAESARFPILLRRFKRIIAVIVAAMCFIAAFIILWDAGLPERAEYTGVMIPGQLPVAPEISAVAPPFERTNLDGKSVNLGDLRGHPVLVNFWATWCEPCRVEMPGLEAVYQQYEARGLRILAVDLGETPDTMRTWEKQFGITFDMLVDGQEDVAALYQIRGQPSTYVISPSGIITQIFYGPTTPDGLSAAIAPFFPS